MVNKFDYSDFSIRFPNCNLQQHVISYKNVREKFRVICFITLQWFVKDMTTRQRNSNFPEIPLALKFIQILNFKPNITERIHIC